jgi:DNA-binding XRE family transcriptional regulator
MKIDETLLYQRLGHQLRQTREAAELTQAKLAENVGVLRTSITNIEAGRQKAPLHLIYEICAVLQVDIHDILPSLHDLRDSQNSTIEMIGGRLESVSPKSAEVINELLREKP